MKDWCFELMFWIDVFWWVKIQKISCEFQIIIECFIQRISCKQNDENECRIEEFLAI